MKIKQHFNQENLYFTSDTHFAHKNIIEYSNRPFKDVFEMNKKLVENWNSIVPENGVVFHLGDFSFGGSKTNHHIRNSLNGTIYYVMGNHDSQKEINSLKFNLVADLFEITVDTGDKYQKVVLCHYPILSFHGAHKGFYHFYGHCHNTLNHPHPCAIDVGIDASPMYKPFSYSELESIISERKKSIIYNPVDHHI